MSKQQPEYLLQKQICQFLNAQYPSVFFLSDTVASVKLTKMQASRNKAIQKSDFKCPDLLILEPNFQYKGLFLELKTTTPYKRDGTIKASQNDHLKLQEQTLQKLSEKGYCADFVWSLDMAILAINTYMRGVLNF